MNKKILVTGGAGYIGSHTLVELMEQTDYGVISVDNFANSSPETYPRISKITGKEVKHYDFDLTDPKRCRELFELEPGIVAVIHFAAFKLVPESVSNPFKYYLNNIDSLAYLTQAAWDAGVRAFIFSSSCSVYGNIDKLPVTEDTPFNYAESPYAYTKQIGERMLQDFCRIHPEFKCLALRYFNPVGAHHSGLIGEDPINPPTSLVPVITKTAVGIIPQLSVHGTDYNTRDGSCIRDYIHVSDIALAHVKAAQLILDGGMDNSFMALNLGTGKGVSVLEAIKAFESVSGVKLNIKMGPRRDGDVESIYADTAMASSVLDWTADTSIEDMMASAWKWEQALQHQKTT